MTTLEGIDIEDDVSNKLKRPVLHNSIKCTTEISPKQFNQLITLMNIIMIVGHDSTVWDYKVL